MTAPDLVLVPTPAERELLGGPGRPDAVLACVGLGPVAAAARAAQLIARHGPRRVLLAGLAGTYDEDAAPIGSAVVASRVELAGLGAGDGAGGTVPIDLPQWPEGLEPGVGAVTGALPLRAGDGRGALTVLAASGTPAEAGCRRSAHPGAVLEEMEGFAVAFAAHLAGVPVAMVRGVSNRAGDRDRSRWRIAAAVRAAAARMRGLLEEAAWPRG